MIVDSLVVITCAKVGKRLHFELSVVSLCEYLLPLCYRFIVFKIMAKITLKDFSKNEALNGGAFGWAKNGNKEEGLDKAAYGFREGGSGFLYMVDSKTYECNFAGVSMDGDPAKQLFMIEAELEETRGTVASRGEGDAKEEISIDVLQPREYFAMEAMKSIIGTMEDPLHCTTFTVEEVVNKSFEFAQAMMTKAAAVRAETRENPEQEKIEIDTQNVTSTTDKILYNIQASLQDIYNIFKEENVKVDIKNEAVPVDLKVVDGSVPVTVGNNVDVTVTNTVTVKQESSES